MILLAAWEPAQSVAAELLALLSYGCVASIILLCCIPPLHQPIRRVLRPIVIFHVERGLDWVLWAQNNQHSLLTTLYTLSSMTVSIGFYVTFLPAIIWLGYAEVGHRLTVLMSVCLYVGNALKDLISAPRPISRELKTGADAQLLLMGYNKQDTVNAMEYGLPSSHVMNSLVLNFCTVNYAIHLGMLPAAYTAWLYAAAGLWVAWIGSARIYMGMHTPIDCFAGAVAGSMVLISWLAVDDMYFDWLLATEWHRMLLLQVLATIILLRLHPKPLSYTPSYEYTTSFLGVTWGMSTGISRVGYPIKPFGTYMDSDPRGMLFHAEGLFFVARRLFVGFLLVAMMKEISKGILVKVLPPVYAGVPLRLRRLWQPPLHSLSDVDIDGTGAIPVDAHGNAWDVEVTARFLSYAALGWTIVELAPAAFTMLET